MSVSEVVQKAVRRDFLPQSAETLDHADLKKLWANPTGYVMEPKLDGHRMQAFVDADGVRCYSRRGKNQSGYLPHIEAELLEHFPAGTVLDGEVVALGVPELHAGDGWSSVQKIMGRGRETAARMSQHLTYVVFDMLVHGAIDTRGLSFVDRRIGLERIFEDAVMGAVALVPQCDVSPEHYERMLVHGFEGSMVKRLSSPYACGKRGWGLYKVKPTDTLDGVIIGAKPGQGDFTGLIGSIEFGQYRNGRLVHRGYCSGMDYQTRLDLSEPVDVGEEGRLDEAYLGRVVEVKHNGVFESGDLRFARFVRFRPDKPAKECVWTPTH